MTLDYKILWIDDREEFFGNHKDYIEEYLEDLGFDAKITTYQSFAEFEEKEKEATHQKIYDLFLIDLNLDHDKTGDELIAKIRENRILTDIIFYSTVLQNVRNKVNENNIEGVYVTSKNQTDFEEKVTDVIDVTIKKVQDVNNLRGLIMAEFSELERIKERIIKGFNSRADNAFRKYVKEDVFEKIKDDLENLRCIVKVEDSECSHDEINLEELQKNFFYDAYKKSRTVYKIKKQACNEIDFTHQTYYDCVIKKRNVFAHQEEEIREDGIKILKYPNGDDLEFTAEHCIQIRKDIKKYKIILKEIEIKINE
jgi:CheY-like chemotaxis protein